MYCRVCGKELPKGAVRCDECGTPTDTASENTRSGGSGYDAGDGYYQDNRNRYNGEYGYTDNNSGREPVYEKQSGARKGFAIASLVLGIVGIVGSCCSMVTFGVLSILLGIVGLIFGILGLKSQGKGMAIAGIIMACLNIVIGIILMILMIASMQMTQNMTPEEYEQIIEQMESIYGQEMIQMRRFFLK